MISGTCFAGIIKMKHLKSTLCLALVLVTGLCVSHITATWGSDYGLSPNNELDPWVGMYFETTIDGVRTNCNSVDCVDDNIPTVVEGQQFKVDIDCAYGDEKVYYSDDFTYDIESTMYGNPTYDGLLIDNSSTGESTIDVPGGFMDTYSHGSPTFIQGLNAECRYNPDTGNYVDNIYIHFKVREPDFGMQLSVDDTSLCVGESANATIEFWGEIEEKCTPDLIIMASGQKVYTTCSFLDDFVNRDNGKSPTALLVDYVRTTYDDGSNSSKFDWTLYYSQRSLNWVRYAKLALGSLFPNAWAVVPVLVKSVTQPILDTSHGGAVQGTAYDEDMGKYIASYTVEGLEGIPIIGEKHKLTYRLNSQYSNNIYLEDTATITVIDPDCGNSVRECDEECDDGNTDNEDGCDIYCKDVPFCGDSEVEGSEECDDGNTTPGDGCDEWCHSEAVCGDGVLEGTEECDDGNTNYGDGCSGTCELECTIDNLKTYPTADFDDDSHANESDNCPCTYNYWQTDADSDNVGDTDFAHLENGCDNCQGVANGEPEDLVDVNEDSAKNFLDGDVRQVDTDNDGYGDKCDVVYNACGETDADGDGVYDLCDNCASTYNPDQLNIDGDSLGSSCDNCDGVDNEDQANTDGDEFGDACDTNECGESDTDGDGVFDGCDNCPEIENPDQTDTDQDSVGDACAPVISPQIVDPEPEAEGETFVLSGGGGLLSRCSCSFQNAAPDPSSLLLLQLFSALSILPFLIMRLKKK